MANANLFNTRTQQSPRLTRNRAGGLAYVLSPKHALAQYAATGCFNSTFYSHGSDQLASVAELAKSLDVRYVARVALWAREHGQMKDMPALLLAVISVRDPRLFEKIFLRVIDSTRMLSTFVRMVRSGVAGRKSLGTRPRRMIGLWLARLSDEQLFTASVGTDPSVRDIIRLAHPKPQTPSRAALQAYLLGREHDAAALPQVVREFDAFVKSLKQQKGGV